MGTRIYNGYKLPKMSMQELLVFCKEMAKSMKAEKEKIISRTLAKNIITQLDNISTGVWDKAERTEKAVSKSLLGNASGQMRERIEKRSKYERDPSFDFEASVSIFPMKNKILCLFYCEHPDLTKIWDDHEKVGDYHYQNQADKPDSIPTSAWNKREKDWNSVLGEDGWGLPVDNSFSFTFTNKDVPYPACKIEDVIAAMPSFEERLNIAAREKYINNYVKEKTEDLPENERALWENASTHYLAAINRYKTTDDGKAELEAVRDQLYTQLIPSEEITVDFIRGDYYQI